MKKLVIFAILILGPILSFGQVTRAQYLLDIDATIYTNGTHKITAVADNALRKEEANSILFFADSGIYYLTPYGVKNALTFISPLVNNTGTVTIGNIPVTKLNSGTGASSSTFWRGDGTWSAAPSATVTAWGLLGNSGTVDGTNFIGTTDNIPFNIRVNNQKSGRIDNTLQNVALGYVALENISTGYFNTAIGDNALNANQTGLYNTAVGGSALLSTTAGYNTAVGANALRTNDAGTENASVGFQAMYNNTGGNFNTALGASALYDNISGNGNTAVGNQCFPNNTTGSNNVAMGYNTGTTNVSGSGNIFLGASAGFYETGSDKLFIWNQTAGDEATDRTTALLYGVMGASVATQTLAVNGQFQINDGNQSAGKVFTCNNSSGVGSWQTAPSASLTIGSTAISGGTSGRVLYDNAGVLGEMTTTGSGTVLALATSPTLVTPILGTPTSGTLTNCTGLPLTTGVTGTLGVTNGGTGTSTAFTAGSVVFADGLGVYAQDNANFFWADANNRLGLGTASPAARLDVLGAGLTSDLMKLTDNGFAGAGDNTGLNVKVSMSGDIGLTPSLTGILVNATSIPGDGAVQDVFGADIVADHNQNPYTTTNLFGLRLKNTSTSAGTITNGAGITILAPGYASADPTTQRGLDISNQGNAGTTTSYGLHIRAQSGSTTNWALASDGPMSYFSEKLRIGSSTAPTDYLSLAAGTTSIAPLQFTSGSLTTGGNIRAGQMQFLTDKLYATITTGTAVKEFTLNDAALTSGTVPIATTNGRLTDGFIYTAGTYTPTLTNTTNVAASTAFTMQYVRMGSMVHVWGQVNVDITTTLVATTLGMSLPIASAFTIFGDLSGSCNAYDSDQTANFNVGADATNDRVLITNTGQVPVTNIAYTINFTYVIK